MISGNITDRGLTPTLTFTSNGIQIVYDDGESFDFNGTSAQFRVLLEQILSAADTLSSMQRNASAMRGFFSLQASYVNPGLSYDCSLFDDKGLCFSMTARNTSVSGSGIDSTSGVVTAAYKVSPNIRVGGFVEHPSSVK